MKRFAVQLLAVLALAACADHAGNTSRFDTPESLARALVDALRSGERDRLTQLLGPDAQALLDSGDAVADRHERDGFLAAYDEQHALVKSGDDLAVLEVGADGWPLPIPLVRRDGLWEFDADAGADELVRRRIGRNELGAIAVCIGIVGAQEEFAQQSGTYATKLRSDPGQRNGLFWETPPGEPMSPAGPLLARAAREGYGAGGSNAAQPYHGYFYRPLLTQGPAVTGGAEQPFVEGKQVRGYALVAYPSEYGASGVMSFMVSQDGIIFQKDLGPDTEKLAPALSSFNPDQSWAAIVL